MKTVLKNWQSQYMNLPLYLFLESELEVTDLLQLTQALKK